MKVKKLTKRMVTNKFIEKQKAYRYGWGHTSLNGDSFFYDLGMTLQEFVVKNPLELDEVQMHGIKNRIRDTVYHFESNNVSERTMNIMAIMSIFPSNLSIYNDIKKIFKNNEIEEGDEFDLDNPVYCKDEENYTWIELNSYNGNRKMIVNQQDLDLMRNGKK